MANEGGRVCGQIYMSLIYATVSSHYSSMLWCIGISLLPLSGPPTPVDRGCRGIINVASDRQPQKLGQVAPSGERAANGARGYSSVSGSGLCAVCNVP